MRNRTLPSEAKKTARSEKRADLLGAHVAAHRELVKQAAMNFLLGWLLLYGMLIWASGETELPLYAAGASAAGVLTLCALSRLKAFGGTTPQLIVGILASLIGMVPIFVLGFLYLPGAAPMAQTALTGTLALALAFGSALMRHLPGGPSLNVLLLGSIFVASLGEAFGPVGWSVGGATIFLAWQFAGVVDRSRKGLAERMEREQSLEETSQSVQALLSEFEEHGSDWLFAVDERGQIRKPTRRFAEAMGCDPSELDGRRLCELFEPGDMRRELINHLSQRTAFRRLRLPVAAGKEQRFWSLSARPVSEASGIAMRGVMTDVTTEAQAEARVHRMAHYDALTDLPNRLSFTEQAEIAVSGATATNRCGLLFVDLDHFKAVNDVYGHRAGDVLLQTTAERLKQVVSSSGLVARLGGDEFAILIPSGASPAGVEELAERIATTVSDVVRHDGLALEPTVSIGLAIAPDDATGLKELLHQADMALYASKQDGRNCWRRFDRQMDETAQSRRALATEMKAALKRGEFRLFYQPIVHAKTLELRGFETLVRWIHPTRGFVSPGDFIPIAEESGFIRDLGAWILETAMEEAATWPDHINIAVNVSPMQLRGSEFERTVTDALASTRLAPTRLELEITESVLLEQSDSGIASLKRLRTRGVRFSLDDFGTGFSSLSYLRTFPFNKVKIDRSFVNDMGDGGSCYAIVKAVLSLARDMGMVTVAEGIELPGQLAALQQMGCDQIQGFLISKPLPLEDAREQVAQASDTYRLPRTA
ncbi:MULTISPECIES: putative bifunctional diguanylate cyclase/phosphodiesterase [Pacificimonas]|uniref:EAL domain-containing protein n=1 Tax=Pacificimonas aurantium TaxID=1250540 RepID=A0ABS7WMB8_9SPHN|nr:MULTISPECIES: EAL domain-containing protein [Pacificimonas]MBZ6379099.1 EAL domain-containing protein [Pacificimonas aurantium]